MKILQKVKVVPNSKVALVKEENDYLKIHVNAPAVDGKANQAVIQSLAKHLKIKKRQLALIQGDKSSDKVFEIELP